MTDVVHRVLVPRGAEVLVRVGDLVSPDQEVARVRAPADPVSVALSARLRRRPSEVVECLVAYPGASLAAGDVIARSPEGRESQSPVAGLFLSYSAVEGTALIGRFVDPRPIVAHVRGRVVGVEETAIAVEVPGAVVGGVDGSGEAVHGELVVAVRAPGDELRAAQIDVSAMGRIIVGGSRASAEALTRARAMGVAGIVLGGVLDKELRDFTAIHERRRTMGGMTSPFSLLLLEGYGKVGLDPALFTWFREHERHSASLFGAQRTLYVYDATPPPLRRAPPSAGDRVVVHRRPHHGASGTLLRVVDGLYAAPSGVRVRTGLVELDDGRIVTVPLANVESSESVRPPRALRPGD